MNYNDIIVTHNSLRDVETYFYFRERMRSGAGFLHRERPIYVIRTEDGLNYLTDGHHELTAAFAENVEFPEAKIEVKHYTYDEINSINCDVGYFTPYDPRTHVRKNNFLWFKVAMQNILRDGPEDLKFAWVEDAIRNYTKVYVEPRKIRTIHELKERYDSL